jgi:hypothetical protein
VFGIKGEFDVQKQTVFNRIDSEQLKVWHPGTDSPMVEVEVVLISCVFTAHWLYCPLGMGDVIALMNALISGTVHKKQWSSEKNSLFFRRGCPISWPQMV